MAINVRRSVQKKADIPNFAMDTGSFLQLLQKVFGRETPIKVELENSDPDETTIIDGYEDILSHIYLLKGKMTIELADVSLSFRRYSNDIRYPDSKAATVATFLAELDMHVSSTKRALSFVGKHALYFYFGSFSFLVLVIRGIPGMSIELGPATGLASVLVVFVGVCMMFASMYLLRPTLRTKARDGFFDRNKEKIVWSVLSSFVSGLILLLSLKYGAVVQAYLLAKLP